MEQLEITLSFACFLATFVLVGWGIARRTDNTEAAYITGGRSFGRYVTGLSAGAASNSGFIMIGAVGAGYAIGLSALVFPLGWLLGDLIFWTYFADKVNRTARNTDSYTVPDLISARVKHRETIIRTRTVAAITTIGFVSFFCAAQLLAAGKTVGIIFNVDINIGIIISGVVIVLYCFRGGLSASIWVNFIQAIMMLVTTLGMLALVTYHEGGMGEIVTGLRAVDPALLTFSGSYSLIGLICAFIGFAVTGFGADFSTPQFIVRLAACKSPEEAAKAKWVYIGFLQLTWVSMVLFGMILRLTFPDLADPELGLPTFANSMLPPWLIGVVMAGVFACIASTVDSQILVISNAITIDLMPKLHEKIFTKLGMYLQYTTTIIVGASLIFVSTTLTSSVYTIIQFAGASIGGAFAPAILIVTMNWRTSTPAIIICMVIGAIVSIVWEMIGLNAFMLSTLPAMTASLILHRILMSLQLFNVETAGIVN